MKYKVTTELKTSWWLRLLRWLRLKPKREDFDLLLNYDYFKVGEILDNGFHTRMKVISREKN